VNTNGITQAYNTEALFPGAIYPEDFDIVQPNQSLYACAFLQDAIVKLSSTYLTNYVGDLIVTDAGERTGNAALFIIHWDAISSKFVVRRISLNANSGPTRFEHVTFSPIELPKL
jgi:hypothetical protein